MTPVIRDLVGVTHRFEAASWHNTRCGQHVETRTNDVPWTPVGGRDGAVLPEGTVDCMACLAGRSHLTIEDLRDGVEVRAWVRLWDEGDQLIGSARPITFTRGTNDNKVIFDDLPVGAEAYGYAYFDEDGRDLRYRVMFPVEVWRRHEGVTIVINVGEATIR